MRIFKSVLLALLMAVPGLAQIPTPQLSLTGNIGCAGFPCLNNGVLAMTDANRAMTATETSAVGGIKVTGTWTANRTLTMPAGRFQFNSVENATSGNYSLILCSASGGTCLTIPNGQSATGVWFDGTNVTGALPGGGGIGQLTGDVTAGPGTGSQAATLATVNSSPGTCGDSTHVGQVTVDGKGRTTNCTPVAIAGGGGSLPSASSPGQIVSSVAAGTSYATQSQLFYAQSGDTISSIETECSALCTYVVTTPQTITLSGNHTLSSNVQLDFKAGGLWTVNGSYTLTVPGNVSGTLDRHFAGSSVILFGAAQREVFGEWFGAVGDGATDDAVAMRKALTALSNGNLRLLGKTYAVSGALLINKNGVGIVGEYPGAGVNSTIMSTSASADIVDVFGASGGGNITGNQFLNFNLTRSVAPSGTATGMNFQYTVFASLQAVTVYDSINGFRFYASAGAGPASIQSDVAAWGYGSFRESSGTLTGFYIDSHDGIQNASVVLKDCNTLSNSGVTATKYGILLQGSSINDFISYDLNASNMTYGVYINYTGSGAVGTGQDIHLYGSILDLDEQAGIYVNNVTNSGAVGSVEISGGWILSNVDGVQITNSSNLTVTGVQIATGIGGSAGAGIRANSTSKISVVNNKFLQSNTGSAPQSGVLFTSVADSVVANNTFSAQGNWQKIIDLNGSNQNSITGNTIVGSSASLVTLESSNRNIITSNSFDTTTSTTGIVLDASSASNSYSPNTYSSSMGAAAQDATGGSNPTFITGGLSVATASSATNTAATFQTSNTTNTAINILNTSNNAEWALFVGGSGVSAGDAGFCAFDYYSGGNTPFCWYKTSFGLASTTVLNWTFGAVGGTPDTGLSRAGAGVLDLGNGTAGNASGTLNLAQLAASGPITATLFNGVPLTNLGSSSTYLDATGHYTTPSGGGGGGYPGVTSDGANGLNIVGNVLTTGVHATVSSTLQSEVDSSSSPMLLMGQLTAANPKKLLFFNTPASNTFTIQAQQNGIGYNQTIALNPSGGNVTAPNLGLPSGGLITFNGDTGISRTGADILNLGNGTAGDASGSLNLYQIAATGTIQAYGFQGGIAGWSSQGNGNFLTPSTATSSLNYPSPTVTLSGNYWTGSAGAADSWQTINTLGAGANPTSTLSFTHSGSSGDAGLQAPNFILPATGGRITWGEPSVGVGFALAAPGIIDCSSGQGGTFAWCQLNVGALGAISVTTQSFVMGLTTPATSTSTCQFSQMQYDANYIYICTSTNNWRRVALSSF